MIDFSDKFQKSAYVLNAKLKYEALQCPKNLLSQMDTLRFWKCRKDSIERGLYFRPLHPLLNGDVERTWSAAGMTVKKRRSNISSENLKAIMLMNRTTEI